MPAASPPPICETPSCDRPAASALLFSAPSPVTTPPSTPGWWEDTEEFVVRWKPDGTRLAVNPAYCRRYGCEAKELIGFNLRQRLDRDTELALEAKIAALSPAQPVWTEQRPAVTPQGIQTWQEWVTRGFFDAQGKLVELQSLGRDITLQKDLSLAMDEIARSLLTIRGAGILSRSCVTSPGCWKPMRVMPANSF